MKEYGHQLEGHQRFTAALPADKDWAKLWTETVERWEDDDQALNPYCVQASRTYIPFSGSFIS